MSSWSRNGSRSASATWSGDASWCVLEPRNGTKFAEIELQQEEVTVERVPRGVPIDVVPSVREEDGVLIIPVVEEQLVVTKRLILKEEIRITRRSRTRARPQARPAPIRAGGR